MSILVIAGVSWAFGTWALRALDLEAPAPAWPLRFLMGLCLCGTLVLAVGLYSLTAVRLVLYGVAALGVGYEIIVRETAMGMWGARHAKESRWTLYEILCATAVAAALTMSFVAALAPAVGWEETTAHLPLARSWADLGRIQFIEANPFSVFATPVHCIYAYAYFEDGQPAVRLLSWLLGTLACGVAYDLARRIAGLRAGWIAAAAVATAPVFYEDAGSVSVELVVAALVAESLLLWREWVREGGTKPLVAAGFVAGNAAVLRPSGTVALGLLTLFVTGTALLALLRGMAARRSAQVEDVEETLPDTPVPEYVPAGEAGTQGYLDFDAAEPEPEPADDDWDDTKPLLERVIDSSSGDEIDSLPAEGVNRMAGLLACGQCLGVMALPALVALLPWWVYALYAGAYAPGFPYAGSAAEILRVGSGSRLGHWFMFPWDIVMRPHWFDGWVHSPGGLVLFLGVPGIVWGGRWARGLGLFAVLGGLALYRCCPTGQAFLPLFMPMLVVASVGIVKAPRWRGALAALALAYFAYQLGLDGLRVMRDAQALSGAEARDRYRAFREPYRPAYGWIGERADRDDVVLSLDPQAYFMRNPAYRNYGMLARMAGSKRQEWQIWLKERNINFVLYPRSELEAVHGFKDSALAQAMKEMLNDREMFRKVEVFSGESGSAEVYRATWK